MNIIVWIREVRGEVYYIEKARQSRNHFWVLGRCRRKPVMEIEGNGDGRIGRCVKVSCIEMQIRWRRYSMNLHKLGEAILAIFESPSLYSDISFVWYKWDCWRVDYPRMCATVVEEVIFTIIKGQGGSSSEIFLKEVVCLAAW